MSAASTPSPSDLPDELAGEASEPMIYAITHIDIIPFNMEAGDELLLHYASEVRDQPGLVRFELLRQVHRPNHYEMVAVWASETAYVDSLRAPTTLAFRERLHPLLGSPFDDRIHVAAGPA